MPSLILASIKMMMSPRRPNIRVLLSATSFLPGYILNRGRGHVDVLGLRMEVPEFRRSAYLFKEIFIDRCYEWHTANPNPSIIDGGGNIGMSVAWWISTVPGCHVVAFEPSPEAYGILSGNIRRNGLSAIAMPYALLDRDGPIRFHDEGASVANSLYDEWPPKEDHMKQGGYIEVQGIRLSHFVEDEVDLLKLDIEGGEHAVLRDLIATGKLHFIKEILCEYHYVEGHTIEEFSGLLEAHGFRVERQSKRNAQGFVHAVRA